MLIHSSEKPEDQAVGKALGFTHIMAVNNYYWYRYKDGTIADKDFSGSMIVHEKDKKRDDIPFGLIIFSVTMPLKYPDLGSTKARKYKVGVGELLTKAIAHHIRLYMGKEFKNQRVVPVIYQTMSRRLTNHFEELVTNKREYSKDGARIICFEIDNTPSDANERLDNFEQGFIRKKLGVARDKLKQLKSIAVLSGEKIKKYFSE
jgi:hypothetical protein